HLPRVIVGRLPAKNVRGEIAGVGLVPVAIGNRLKRLLQPGDLTLRLLKRLGWAHCAVPPSGGESRSRCGSRPTR
ncbi:MAG: hypothetical protein ACK55I_31230, partial [bacterium]